MNILKARGKSLAFNTDSTYSTFSSNSRSNNSKSIAAHQPSTTDKENSTTKTTTTTTTTTTTAAGEMQRVERFPPAQARTKQNADKRLTRQSKIHHDPADFEVEQHEYPSSANNKNNNHNHNNHNNNNNNNNSSDKSKGTLGLIVSRSGRFREKARIRSRVVSMEGESFISIFGSTVDRDLVSGGSTAAPSTKKTPAPAPPPAAPKSALGHARVAIPEDAEVAGKAFAWLDSEPSEVKGTRASKKRISRYLSLDLAPTKGDFSVLAVDAASTQL